MSTDLLAAHGCALPPSNERDLAMVMAMRRQIEDMARESPCDFPTKDLLHAGCYVRTCFCPAGSVLAGAVIKVPTVVIVHGVCTVTTGGTVTRIEGFAVMKGAPGRATVWCAESDTYITMVFASDARTGEEAEEEFTDEYTKLLTRKKE